MDTLVMPSELEGYGLVAMEAMMCGVPLIATPFGMVADLVTDGVDGLVVSLAVDSIVDAIAKLDKSPELCRCLVSGGRRLAERSGYAATMAREYESLLWHLWGKRNPTRQRWM